MVSLYFSHNFSIEILAVLRISALSVVYIWMIIVEGSLALLPTLESEKLYFIFKFYKISVISLIPLVSNRSPEILKFK